MTDSSRPAQAVKLEVGAKGDVCFIRLTTPGVPPIEIPMDPQAAFEAGENLARAAHRARFGEDTKSDKSYLHEQILQRTTEDLRLFVTQRAELMLNSLREDRTWNNRKLAEELVDRVMAKVM